MITVLFILSFKKRNPTVIRLSGLRESFQERSNYGDSAFDMRLATFTPLSPPTYFEIPL
jgi:hypothetical protein